MVLAALGLRWLAAPQRHREARASQQREALELRAKLAENDEGLTVTYAVEHHPPLALTAIDDAATMLSRLRAPAPGFDLDVPATLDATLRAAGMLVPVFLASRQPLHLTVLVDVEKGSHPFLDGALWLLARWQLLGVRLVRHDFAFQPTRLRVHGTGVELGFDELSRRSARVPLLIISRVTQLATRRGVLGWQRDLASWSTCALLDLDPRPPAERSGEDERVLSVLAQAGLRRFPFTDEGLKALAHTLAAGSARPPTDAPLLPLRAVEPAIRRWAACVACVPDPTWAQLEAFRRGFLELRCRSAAGPALPAAPARLGPG